MSCHEPSPRHPLCMYICPKPVVVVRRRSDPFTVFGPQATAPALHPQSLPVLYVSVSAKPLPCHIAMGRINFIWM